MSNWWKNIFGSIGRGVIPLPEKMDFIPTAAGGDATTGKNVLFIPDGDPKWVGFESAKMQFWAYAFCSPLSAVIDRLAEADINGEPMFLKNNGSDDVSNTAVARRLRKLFKRPNPTQTWYELRAQQSVYKKTYGFCPVFAMVPSGFDVTEAEYLWNLNPYYAKPVRNDNFSLFRGDSAIKEWKITIFGVDYTIPSDRVFVLKDGYIDKAAGTNQDTLVPMSKVCGLDWAISNILAAMEADNVLLRKKGPLGFISHDPKPDNVAGYVPMTNTQKTEIQQNLTQYGLTWSQFQYVISRLPVRWNPMSFNVKDLMTKETTKQAIEFICDRYNYPAELMSGKNATYENRNSAEKFVYQNNVIPSSIRDSIQFINFFEMEDHDIKFIQDFSKLPVLQEDVQKAAAAAKDSAEANLTLFQNNVITLNQYRFREGIETIEGDDIYFAAYVKKYKVEESALKPVAGGKAA